MEAAHNMVKGGCIMSGKPFLKWAGGKNWFIKYLPKIMKGLEYNTYHEPFLGGGSVFFHLEPTDAYLSDANLELINTYQALQDDVEAVIDFMQTWEVNENQYYEIRATKPTEKHEQAARFIYLNHTSFNGIYRVNRKGEYNVPYGHRDNYAFDFDRIRAAASSLQGAILQHREYQETLKDVSEGDFVFLDPPYTVAHNNNGFIEYNKKLFSIDDQFLLRDCIVEICDKGAYFILTNAAHDTIKDIFRSCGTSIELDRFSTLGGKNARRQSISECIFTNIPSLQEV